jgi:hypothetical protein
MFMKLVDSLKEGEIYFAVWYILVDSYVILSTKLQNAIDQN